MSDAANANSIPPFRRRVLLINTRFQMSMIFYGLLLIVLVTAIFYFYEAFFLFQISELVMEKTGADSELMHSIEYMHTVMFPWFMLVLIAIALIIMSFLLLLSHRIAGPIYHAVMYLNLVAKDPSKKRRIKFREKDYFPELADAVNAALPTEQVEKGNADPVGLPDK